MHLFLQMSKLQETTSYFDENVGRVGVESDTVSGAAHGFCSAYLGSLQSRFLC